jgi:hypothetical protein
MMQLPLLTLTLMLVLTLMLFLMLTTLTLMLIPYFLLLFSRAFESRNTTDRLTKE